ncbi:MAG: hypothetical protein H6606_05405 [Flavobacteriales bacterium]|nr:hypothetical protein [Flavobacteriales bacterium]
MKGDFEKIIQEKLYDAEVQAPDVLGAVFERRTASHIFFNKLYVNRYKIMTAAAILILLFGLGWWKLKPVSTENGPAVTDGTEQMHRSGMAGDPGLHSEDRTGDHNHSEATDSPPAPDDASVEEVVDGTAAIDQIPDVADERETTVAKDQGTVPQTPVVVNNTGGTPEPIVPKSETENNDQASGDLPVVSNSETPETPKLPANIAAEDQGADKSGEDDSQEEPVEIVTEEKPLPASGDRIEKPIEVPTGKPMKWSLSAQVGPSYGSRHLRGGSDAVRNLRNESEFAELGLSAGLNLGYQFLPGWEVLSGIQYHQRNESLRYTHESTRIEEQVRNKEVKVYDPFGGSRFEQVQYIEQVEHREQKVFDASNSYRHLSMMLGVRKQFKVGAFRIDPSVAVAYRTWMQTQAVNLQPGLRLETYDRIYPQQKASSWQGRLGVVLGMPIRDHWMFYLEPAGTYFLTPSERGHGAVIPDQRDYFFDLNTGLRFQF